MHVWFCFLNGGLAGQIVAVSLKDGGVARIGRGPENDVIVAGSDVAVSAAHARVIHRAGRIELHDAGSRNGTWVNGHRIESVEVSSGTHVNLGGEHGVEVEILCEENLDLTQPMRSAAPEPEPAPAAEWMPDKTVFVPPEEIVRRPWPTGVPRPPAVAGSAAPPTGAEGRAPAPSFGPAAAAPGTAPRPAPAREEHKGTALRPAARGVRKEENPRRPEPRGAPRAWPGVSPFRHIIERSRATPGPSPGRSAPPPRPRRRGR